MPLEDRESRCSSAVRFKTTDEVMDGYLTCAPLAHALHRAAEAYQLAKIALPAPILDVGCGTGEFASLALEGRMDVGVDRNARVLPKAARTGRYDEVRCADACRLPFDDGQFQTVLAVSVFEHISQPRLALAEAFRVLRPGGQFIATIVLADLHEHLFYPRLMRTLGLPGLANGYCRLQDRLFGHRSLMPGSGWEKCCLAAGFEAVECRPILTPRLTKHWDRLLLSALPYRMGLCFAWHPRWFRRLAIRWGRDAVQEQASQGSNILLIARKPPVFVRVSRGEPVRETISQTVSHAYAHA
jgi:SAM-dependent methyltransferase